jgi:tRNA(Arg) A34 adenosine deaminase TadA
MSILDFFGQDEFEHRRVAAVLCATGKPKPLYYAVGAADDPVPPTVYLIEGLGRTSVKAPYFTNYPLTWINKNFKYNKEFPVEQTDREVHGHGATVGNIPLPAKQNLVSVDDNQAFWGKFGLAHLGAKPNLGGGSLYDYEVSKEVSRARRAYMLAAFCLLKKYGYTKASQTMGHNIASILVKEDGEVIGWGVNTAEYRHAEVSTLISYFRRNPTAKKLPKRSVLFTTLQPCEMCANFIKSCSDANETRVWFAQDDTGMHGNSVTLGDQSKPFTGEVVTEEGKVTGTKPLQYGTTGAKVKVADQLAAKALEKKKGESVADWTASPAATSLFDDVTAVFDKKAEKDRAQGPMKSVLAYLKGWLDNIAQVRT